MNKLVDVGLGGQLFPTGLVDAELIEHGGELVAVLGAVDRHGRRAQNRDMTAVKLHRKVVGDLAADTHDHAARCLKIDDVHHALKRQLVEIEAVTHVIVRRHGLGIVVDHDRTVAEFAAGVGRVHRTPVKFNRRSDAVGSRAENHDVVA